MRLLRILVAGVAVVARSSSAFSVPSTSAVGDGNAHFPPLSKPSTPSSSSSWTDLEDALLPKENPSFWRMTLDAALEPTQDKLDRSKLRLFRERNGWCLYSARVWLALEVLLEDSSYQTVLLEARGDTYDGGGAWEEDSSADHVGRPEALMTTSNLPLICLPNSDDYHEASNETSLWQVLQLLAETFPNQGRRLLPEDSKLREQIYKAAKRYEECLPKQARSSPRAGWMFSEKEGYRLDALPRTTFEEFLDAAEVVLAETRGSFFGGDEVSLADIVWAPLLERYRCQIPCLHPNFDTPSYFSNTEQTPPSHAGRWPLLRHWYQAFSVNVPAYSCRIRGDYSSWRKVLFRDPWWPKEDLWHSRDSVGPKGELCLSAETCLDWDLDWALEDDSTTIGWQDYARTRTSYVSPVGPATEAACIILRKRDRILTDLQDWWTNEGLEPIDKDSLEKGLQHVVRELHVLDVNDDDDETSFERSSLRTNDNPTVVLVVPRILEYLVRRVCVPRDMGALSAAAMYRLHKQYHLA